MHDNHVGRECAVSSEPLEKSGHEWKLSDWSIRNPDAAQKTFLFVFSLSYLVPKILFAMGAKSVKNQEVWRRGYAPPYGNCCMSCPEFHRLIVGGGLIRQKSTF